MAMNNRLYQVNILLFQVKLGQGESILNYVIEQHVHEVASRYMHIPQGSVKKYNSSGELGSSWLLLFRTPGAVFCSMNKISFVCTFYKYEISPIWFRLGQVFVTIQYCGSKRTKRNGL